MFNRGLVLRVLAALLFAVVLLPSSGWATATKNCPVEPVQNTPIVSGETYWGTNCVLNTTGDVDSFTFSAAAGDTWRMVAGFGTSITSDVCLTLYAPGSTGTSLFSGCTSARGVVDSVATNQELAVAGTYTIVITEAVDGATLYGLSLERINPPPPDAVALVLSNNVAAEVNPPTAQDAYTFFGATTGTYQIAASYTGGGTDVCFNVYQSGVTVLPGSPPCTSIRGVVDTVKANVTPKANGTFVVVVYAATNDGVVNYDLEVTCFLGTCPIKPPQTPPCALTDKLSYDATSGTLTMNFTLGTKVPVTWNAWLTSQNTMQSLWSQSLPITEPQVSVTKTQALAKAGKVGVLSTFTTPTGGITCSSWTQVNTGKP